MSNHKKKKGETLFGNNLRFLRGKRSQEKLILELLEKHNVDLARSSIGFYERNITEPSFHTLLTLSKHFDVSINDFLTKDLSIQPNKSNL